MRARASILLVLAALAGLGPARAQEPAPSAEADACASFDWPLARELSWFSDPGLPAVASGASLPADRPAALLGLKPFAEAGLPQAPSRAPKPGSHAGYVRLPGLSAPGQVQVTLSGESWVDVAEEGGAAVRPATHSGRKGCALLRKSVRFPVGAGPLVVTVSNATADAIRLAVTPVD